MKNFAATLATLISGFASVIDKAEATGPTEQSDPLADPVSLRPLNLSGENMFAAHRSHSSHGSHRSHRSGSGGGYRSPAPSQPSQRQPAPAPGRGLSAPGTAQPTDPGRAATVSPTPAKPRAPVLSRAEKLKLQVMRTKIALTSLGLYSGPINGELDSSTKESLKNFQTLKGLAPNGLMTTETLNALGVPAVQ